MIARQIPLIVENSRTWAWNYWRRVGHGRHYVRPIGASWLEL